MLILFGCSAAQVHHPGSLKNKDAGTCIEITSSGELVTLRTVCLYNEGVHPKSTGGAELFSFFRVHFLIYYAEHGIFYPQVARKYDQHWKGKRI